MPWIKIQTTLIDDPSVSAIGARLRMAEAHVVGCLVAIWSWADSLTADGFIQHATAAQIDKKAGKKGFADAMTCVGWLRVEPAGVVFPKWDRHNGESAKARAGEAEAKRLSRAGVRRSGPVAVSAPTPSTLSGQMSGHFPDECPDQRRGEEKREENTNTPPIPPAGGGCDGPDTAERLNDSPALALALESEPAPSRPNIDDAKSEIYAAYPRKVGKADALNAIAKALKSNTFDKLLAATKAYAEAVAEWPEADRQYIPHPSTWFNGARYDDDPATWVRSGNANNKRPAPSAGSSYAKEAQAHAYTL